MRPTFDATLIADLRRRVVAHNEQNPAQRVGLDELKKAYAAGFRRSEPHTRAMRRVDTLLLAKAAPTDFQEQEHPRDGDGKFTSGSRRPKAATITLPTTDADHRALQASNAGYRALTSGVINEQRNEQTGAFVRDAGTMALGAATIAGLTSGNKLTRKVGRGLGGMVGAAALGIPTGVIVNSARGASLAARKLTRGLTPVIPGTAAKTAKDAAARLGRKGGRALGDRSVASIGRLLRLPIEIAGRGGMSAASKFGRKAAAFGLLAATAGGVYRNAIQGTSLDPEVIGRGIDAYTYRTVAKAVASEEMGAAKREIVAALRKSAPGGAGSVGDLQAWLAAGGGEREQLAKAFSPWIRHAAQAAIAGAGALGGAALGGIAGYAGSRLHSASGTGKGGNPYRDAEGKFTSKDKAVTGIGAIAGGIGGALALGLALRRHNAGKVMQAIGWQRSRSSAFNAAIKSGKAHLVQAFEGNRAARVEEMIGSHAKLKPVADKIANLKMHQTSAEPALRAQMKRIFDDQMVARLMGHEELQIPNQAGKGARALGDIMADAEKSLGRRATTDQINAARLKAATEAVGHLVGRGDQKALKQAMAKLPEAEHTAIADLQGKAKTALEAIPAQIHAHNQAKEQAAEHVKAMTSALKDAETAQRAAQAAHTNASAEGKAAAKQALDHAVDKVDAAHGLLTNAEQAKQALDKVPTGVHDPFTNAPLKPPAAHEIAAQIGEAETEARNLAGTLFDKEKASYQGRLLNENATREARNVAAIAAAGRFGSPGKFRTEIRAINKLRTAHKAAAETLRKAETELKATKRRYDQLKEAMSAGSKGLPKGMDQETADKLLAEASEIRARHTAATKAHGAAAEALAVADKKWTDAGHAFIDTLERQPKRFLSPDIRNQLEAAKDTLSAPLRGLLKNPTSARLARFLAEFPRAAARGVGDAANRTTAAIGNTARELVLENKEGVGTIVSPTKLVRNAGALAAIYEAGRVLHSNAVDHVLAGVGNEEAKSRVEASKKRTDGFKWEQHEDKMTGVGYHGVSIPHPTEKGERMMLWGERTEAKRGLDTQATDDGAGFKIPTGAKVSQVRERVKQQAQRAQQQQAEAAAGGGGGSSSGAAPQYKPMSEADQRFVADGVKGQKSTTVQGASPVSVAVRDASDDTKGGNEAQGKAVGWIRHQVGGSGSLEGGAYHTLLDAVFSPHGRGMKAARMFIHLTGHTADGQVASKDKPIFGANPDFGSKDHDTVVKALGAELDRVADKAKPSTVDQVQNLHRAFAIVANVKGISDAKMKPLHDRIAAMKVAPTPEPPKPAPAEEAKPATAVATKAQEPKGSGINAPQPAAKERAAYKAKGRDEQVWEHAEKATPKIAKLLNMKDEEHEALHGAVFSAARAMDAEGRYEKLDPSDFVEAVRRGIEQHVTSKGIPEGERRKRFLDGDLLGSKPLEAAIHSHATKLEAERVMSKLTLDDLDGRPLRKGSQSFGEFSESLHPRAPAGGEDGGQFTAKNGGGARKPRDHDNRDSLSWYHPTRLGAEFGGAVGGQGAYMLADKFLPLGLGRVARFGAKMVASGIGAGVGESAGHAAGNAGLKATGQKAVKYERKDGTAEEEGAGFVGSVAGGYAGEALGTALGTVAGPAGAVAGALAVGSLGGYLGETAGKSIYRFFHGYGEKEVERAVARFATPDTGLAAAAKRIGRKTIQAVD